MTTHRESAEDALATWLANEEPASESDWLLLAIADALLAIHYEMMVANDV